MNEAPRVRPHALNNVVVPGREILRCEVGSTLHGIGIGSDDLDLMGVTVEPTSTITGLGRFEHFVWRTADEGQRSGPDDVDLTVYGLKKYVWLATEGNPTVLLPLYAPDAFLTHVDEYGAELRALRGAIVSQVCRPRFLGYLESQRRRVLERRGSGRGSLEGRWEKWASHMVRLGFEACELLSTGELTLPMPAEHAEYCKAIKRGDIALDEALTRAEELEQRAAAIDTSPLPAEPDLERVQTWMHGVYQRVLFDATADPG
ncbi:hypothetical protein BH23ACT10_BH23ACT10_19630 [soil metagenome]